MNQTKANKKADFTIGLMGNPNVGKSTVFNALTGLHQHTGNWSGKTVANARGTYLYRGSKYLLTDIPGTYSLKAHSREEEVARDFVLEKNYDALIVVCDATSLERNLNLVLQILEITRRVVVCVNLLDEAERKGISVDFDELSRRLGVPVVGTSACRKSGLSTLTGLIWETVTKQNSDESASAEKSAEELVKEAEIIAKAVVTHHKKDYLKKEETLDRILTGKWTGIPVMLCFLALIFWITLVGANYPSRLLSLLFQKAEHWLIWGAAQIGVPAVLSDFLFRGIFSTVGRIISVMLPPMAIFFPLFTLLEDLGYLPRIAFNLDHTLQKCNACGKQALTMCMGFGCNAVGVTGARIMDSRRERLLAILTNSLVPCNGKFPTLLAIITAFFAQSHSSLFGALLLTSLVLFGILMTFLVSLILSKTVLKGEPSFFVLELPPYRKPQILKVLFRSLTDRTLFVLGRAVTLAMPAGAVLWMVSHIHIGNTSLLLYLGNLLNPFGILLGMDGVILIGFLLGLPANEIVLPIILMAYTGTQTLTDTQTVINLHRILTANGWTSLTAVCMLVFSMFHWPCSTTLMTIQKETGSFRWTFLSAVIPTGIGITLCLLIRFVRMLF